MSTRPRHRPARGSRKRRRRRRNRRPAPRSPPRVKTASSSTSTNGLPCDGPSQPHLEHVPLGHRSGKDHGCRTPCHLVGFVSRIRLDRGRVRRAADARRRRRRAPPTVASRSAGSSSEGTNATSEPSRPSRNCVAIGDAAMPGMYRSSTARAAGLSRASPKVEARSNMRILVVRSFRRWRRERPRRPSPARRAG